MFTVIVVGALFALPLRAAWSQSTTPDTAAILREVWAAATMSTPRPAVLWIPRTDTAPVVSISAEVRNELMRRGVPVFENHPAGDDTVVYHITRWKVDSAGVIVRLASEWTEVIGQGARRCRAKSGNIEQFRIRQENGMWVGQRLSPIMHGDGACAKVR
ncbi:MAG TPA: hypothetical protein VJN70_05385 [Gemmatimonadaceae bacterium]|nr:hypothetical protein [Gemmatimonadaceae bacterium]